MASNGTPRAWQDRAKAQQPRRIVTSEKPEDRPAVRYEDLELRVDEEEPTKANDLAALLLAFGVLAMLLGLALFFPDVLRIFREWWLN